MSSETDVKLVRQGSIAIVTIDRLQKRNALSQQMLIRLTHIADELLEDSSVGAVVLTGSHDLFSAGIDLKDPDRWNVDNLPLRQQREVMQRGRNLATKWEALPQVTIAAIEGYAIGAGFALAMSCDWRVMADDAYLWLPEVLHGISLGWGALPKLVNLVGPAKAKELIILGDKISSADAERLRLVNWIVAKGTTRHVAMQYASRVVELPPVPVIMTKEAVNACAGVNMQLASYMEADQANFLRLHRTSTGKV